MKLKYYGIGISLAIVAIYGTLTFIDSNYRNSKIKNNSEEIAKSVEQINTLDNKEDIDNKEDVVNDKSQNQTSKDNSISLQPLPIPNTNDSIKAEELPIPNSNLNVTIDYLS
ncbi:hypothetical protein [Clostridium saccharobutylicum]|uniref:Uncharacterized protein n=1 Tax=Clostridium saccharobutylicum DSM 13864 TaxID=1345695 RepID=U5MYA5_CLOSA|nr:hypothetical protein [Clostridium saccharobutylicum]AGX44432.1 hypothetical protein CLSA_c34700 [Clostridium saccharobutylicum DSM 13864]AQR91727.1 hypothetical protein CLOSC_34530 [Clostridium saccharobutylicum]AQS01629.1 hypothetical protein CSACC_34580 [Clostridium saccharobutylicum]AQS15612.1 hypothetical protein CLOSACC_34580 [Clostridium saccharobutylicum]MBA2907659.1 hypothetical protein [Clostridium saccharobutylicum]